MTSLLATDLDGTLLDSFGKISQQNVDAIVRAKADGLEVVFATGRPPRWMDEIPSLHDAVSYSICANGAVLFDLTKRAIVSAHYIDPDVGRAAIEQIRIIDPNASFAVELAREHDDFVLDDGYQPRWESPRPVPRLRSEELFDSGRVVKLLARPSRQVQLTADSFVAHAEELISHIVDVTHSNSYDVLLEMSPLGVNKGSALAQFALERGLQPANVAAVGDMPNDIPMVTWAGRGGAVENAHDDLKAIADDLLPSNDDHAIATFIHRILGQ